MKTHVRLLLSAALVALPVRAGSAGSGSAAECFEIQVIDAQTRRGVPLVELTTTGSIRYVTDSNGVVAFDEPGLMNRSVFFQVRSHGYEFPADGFGIRGQALLCEPGGHAVLELERINLAERLYRLTGGGIYRDSLLTGRPVPLRSPVLNGQVVGQDSVVRALYRDRIYWFWGDTNRPGYPLGNFAVAGATSPLDVDPDQAIEYRYFVNEQGFARPMCPIEGPGPVWLDGLMTLPSAGRTRLVARFERHKSLGELHECGLVWFDDDAERFAKLVNFELDEERHPVGHPIRVRADGEEFFYFGRPFPNLRVRADLDAVQDPGAYEALAWTGSEYSWKQGAQPIPATHEDSWIRLLDVETGNEVRPHGGSVCWNAYRKRWLAILLEVGGRSYLGEVWLAEADTILGPWAYARRIVTHDRYSFYNVVQHSFLDREQGRFVYFEGTYTDFLVEHPDTTPRYNYNQILYRLDLADPRTALPIPVYGPDRKSIAHFELADGKRLDNPIRRLALGTAVPVR